MSRRFSRVDPALASSIVWDVLRSRMGREEFALAQARAVWATVLHPLAASQPFCWPRRVDGHTLVVDVVNSQWLHELRYYQADLAARIRETCHGTPVQSVRLCLARDPLPAPDTAESSRGEEVRVTSRSLAPDPPADTMQALLAVRDPELRDVLAGARLTLGRPVSLTDRSR